MRGRVQCMDGCAWVGVRAWAYEGGRAGVGVVVKGRKVGRNQSACMGACSAWICLCVCVCVCVCVVHGAW